MCQELSDIYILVLFYMILLNHALTIECMLSWLGVNNTFDKTIHFYKMLTLNGFTVAIIKAKSAISTNVWLYKC